MAWTLSVPVVMAWTLGATQPALEEDSSASADADAGWEAASLDADASADVDTDLDSESDTTTGSISASTASSGNTETSASTDDDLEPISSAPPTVSSGGIEGFKGRFGVGAIRTIAGLNGINFRYFLTDNFSLGGSAGVALFTYHENDPASTDPACPDPQCNLEDTRTVAFMAFNIEGLYFIHLGREAGQLPFRADFGLGGRFGVMTSANAADVEDNLDDPTELHIEIPLVFQLMFGNNFALSPELGMDFRIIPGSREDGDDNEGINGTTLGAFGAADGPGFGWDLTPGVGLFGGASMHYYF